MARLVVFELIAGVLAVAMLSAPVEAETPATQCLYSGPLGSATRHSSDPPLRFDVEAGGRSLRLIHKVQTNYSVNDPFKTPVYGEQPTCRLKLDCTVATEGLKSIVVQVAVPNANGVEPSKNEWTRMGDPVLVKYADAARNVTCHVVGLEML